MDEHGAKQAARLDVILEISGEKLLKYFGAQTPADTALLNEVKAVVAKELSGMHPMRMRKEGTRLLAEKVKLKLNKLLEKRNEGVISDVYIPVDRGPL